jgi:hypothetical protein
LLGAHKAGTVGISHSFFERLTLGFEAAGQESRLRNRRPFFLSRFLKHLGFQLHQELVHDGEIEGLRDFFRPAVRGLALNR